MSTGCLADVLVHHMGYGFVQFLNEDEARSAVDEENGAEMGGKRISKYTG
jgi:RNA recognition motif-containing protein